MLRSFSQTYIVLIAFILGMVTSFMLIAGIGYFAATSVTLKDIEEKTAFPTISEKYIGDYPEVYIRDMTLLEMMKEGKDLADMGDGLTINVMIDRYDLKLPEKANIFLTAAVRDLPLKEVFSQKGLDIITSSVYIGEFQGFERREIDGELVWYDPETNAPVSGVIRVISDLTIDDLLSNNFSFSSLLDDITLGEALGYTIIDGEYYNNGEKVTGLIGSLCDAPINDISNRVNNIKLMDIFGYEVVDGVYYDKDGNKVTGVMSIICDATVDEVPNRINEAKFSDILGYELGEDGCYYENGKKISGVMAIIADCTVTTAPTKIETAQMGEIMGYTLDAESGVWKDSEGNEVHSLMNTISSKKISDLNNLYKDLTVGDVIPADERDGKNGYVSLLNPATPLNEISGEVNRVFKENTMRDFVACGAITFNNDPDGSKAEAFVNSTSPMADMTMDQMMTFMFSNQAVFDQIYNQQNGQ